MAAIIATASTVHFAPAARQGAATAPRDDAEFAQRPPMLEPEMVFDEVSEDVRSAAVVTALTAGVLAVALVVIALLP